MNRKQRRADAKPDRVQALFADALRAHRAGRLDVAENYCRQVLALAPAHAGGLHLLGLIAGQAGHPDAACELIGKAVALRPGDAAMWCDLANASQRIGRLDEAVAGFGAALRIQPDSPELHYNLGNALARQRRPDDAADHYRQALALGLRHPAVHANLGNTLKELGRLTEAEECYRQALALDPRLAEIHNNLGTVIQDPGRADDAVEHFRAAIALDPTYADAHYNLGTALHGRGLRHDAIACYRRALATGADHAEAHYNLGNALRELERPEEAVACYVRALAIRPDQADSHNNLGLALAGLGRTDEALACYRRAVEIQPDYREAIPNLGNALKTLGRWDEALACYRAALATKPGDPELLSVLIHLRQQLCDWDGLDADVAALLDLVHRGRAGIDPFALLSLPSDAAEQLAAARAFATRCAAEADGVVPPRARRPDGRIRLGYLSADFRDHAVASLMVELIERHDRERFEVIGYSTGIDDGGAQRRRLIAGFDRFVELRPLSWTQAADRIAADEVEILVDLTGYTGDARTKILARRPAPIQVNFLGYPGTMGAAFVDYLIADPVCIPPGDEAFYAEAVVRLPHCYQPSDSTRRQAGPIPTRAECGLPARGFVFCGFNNSYKVTPPMFAVWMRLLALVPGSVLWLLETNPAATRNLVAAAQAHGIAPQRLVFAPRLAAADHLARHRLADLFLDTLPYNAHTTASDALWAGLPVLTCPGRTFASRVAASLLTAIGLPEMITATLADYQATAQRLATDPAALAAITATLRANRASAPLFDIGRYAKDIEAAFARMSETYRAGRPAEPIDPGASPSA